MAVTNPFVAFIGSNVTITCFITFEEEIVDGVSVKVLWTGPTNSPITDETLKTGSGNFYTSTLPITNVIASDAGTYMCIASLISSRSFLIGSQNASNSTTVSTGASHTKHIILIVITIYLLRVFANIICSGAFNFRTHH